MNSKFKSVFLLFIVSAAFIFLLNCEKEDPVEQPRVTTLPVTNITINSAKGGGNVFFDGGTNVTDRGIVLSTSENPTIDNSDIKTIDGRGVGEFASKLTNLSPGTTYYVSAYAINSVGTAYGDQIEFTTKGFLPSVTTADVIDITSSSAKSGGEVIDEGDAEVTARGVLWSESEYPTRDNNDGITSDGEGEGEFTSNITGLSSSTKYYIRAYAVNSKGTNYGEQIEFSTTGDLPSVTTAEVTEITSSSAKSGGEVTDEGDSDVTARGVVWSESENPTLNDNDGITTDGEGKGEFTSELTDLLPSATYYLRAYASNEDGTAYGEQVEFTTEIDLATVTTKSITNINTTTASGGGNVTDDGGNTVSSRGVVWSTTENPTLDENDEMTDDGGGTGEFTSELTDLTPNTTYYVRAYAVNSAGTAYGEQVEFTTESDLATVTTKSITNINTTTATGGGNVTDDGGNSVTSRGVVWSTTENPTLDENDGMTDDGGGTGEFTSELTDLTPNTIYYVRAYAVNSEGTGYGGQVEFATTGNLPSITTAQVTEITSSSAKSGGNVTDEGSSGVTSRGIVWSTFENPVIENNDGITSMGSGPGEFTSNLTGLSRATTYYVRAYAINNEGTGYGAQIEFTTDPVTPTVTTANVTEITPSSAKSGGNVTDDGGANVTARGVVWNTSGEPTVNTNDGVTDNGAGTGEFNSNLSVLSPGTTYYVKAYALNSAGAAYGEQVEFTTEIELATVTTKSITNINTTTATGGGNVTDDGGNTVSSRGLVWSTTENPTLDENDGMTDDGGGTGEFTSELTDLTPNTFYYVRAYAVNSEGTGYGEQVEFATTGSLPSVTTAQVTEITSSSAKSGGNVTNEGSSEVTSRGIVWGTFENPRIENNDGITSMGSGPGEFTSNLTGLSRATTYYVRAYAINNEGTGYGAQIEFTTDPVIPTVTTAGINNITTNSATGGGNVTDDGGANVTARGVVWNTSGEPTVSTNDGMTDDGAGTGEFTSNLSGLSPGTNYYVRAYAVNNAGAAYGEQVEFTTEIELATVTTKSITNINTTTATGGGNVTDDGGNTVTSRGVVWSTTENPTLDENDGTTNDGEGTGEFTSNLSGLSPGTTYYVRAYAVNSAGTAYGEQVEFTTEEP